MTAMPVDPAATDYTARLQQMVMPQANFARPNFIQGLTGALFPVQPGVDPQTTQMMQRQAMLALGLGIMGAGSRPGARLGSSLLEGFQGASQTYAGAMNAAFRSQLAKNEQERQQKADERAQKAAESQARQQAGTVASRVSSGIGAAADPMAYWQLVQENPDVQAAMQQFGAQSPQTPEEVTQFGQRMGAAGQISAPTSHQDYTSAQREYALARSQGYAGSFMDYQRALKSTSAPSSWEEFLLSQKDPAFKKFLQERRGKGFSITTPDGTVIEMGGEGSNVGPSELTKPTINKLQETIVNSQDRLDRLNEMATTYDPKYLQARGLVNAKTTEVKDFLGMDVPEQDRRFLQGYTEFRANSAQDINRIIKDMAGSAVTPTEAERQLRANPSENDKSPIAFESKMRAATKFSTRAIMRANWALKNGIGVQSVEQLAKAMPLEGIDAVYEKRANEIWQELGNTPEMKAEAIRRANQEFGIAR